MTDDDDLTRADRAAAGEHEQVDDLELFPTGTLDGDGPTPQTLVKKGMPVELTVSLMKAEVPNRGGLIDPDQVGRALVTYLPAKVDEVPVRGDDDKVKSWKIRQNLRVTYVEAASDTAGLIVKLFDELQATSPSEAGALLDRLQAAARSSLQAA